MSNPTDATTDAHATNTAHRALYEQLTQEAAQWTPELDRCVHVYFELQEPSQPEGNPLEVFAHYGISLGIVLTLHAMGCMSDSALSHMSSFALQQLSRKLQPWNGCEFTLHSGWGKPSQSPTFH